MEHLSQTLTTSQTGVSLPLEAATTKSYWGPVIALSLCSAFMAFKVWMGDVHTLHVLFVLGILSLYFFHTQSRHFIVMTIPILLYGIMYDSFRYIPFDSLLPIHIKDVFQWDLYLFGVSSGGGIIPLSQYVFEVLAHPVFDLISGFIYFLHVPMMLVVLVILWKYGSAEKAQRYTLAFFIMNVLAFSTHFLFPVAAPWYVENFGFSQPMGPIPGDPAGLVRFEQVLGLSFFSENYSISPVIFGAVPSMHAGFSTLGWLYSFQINRKFSIFMGFYVLTMVFSALYLQHHYMVDLVWGIFYALLAWILVEKILLRGVQRVNRAFWKLFVENSPRPFFK